MPIISRDSIQILFTARDRVSGPLRTATVAVNKLATSSGRAIKNLAAMGGRKLIGGIRSLGSALGNLTGIGALLGGGGLSVLVGQGLRAGDELAKTADKIGATTEELGRLNFAFSQTTDLSDGAVGTSLQRLQKRLGDFALNGAGPASKALQTLGLDARSLIDSGLENSIFTISDALQQVESQAERVKIVDSLFGKEGVGLVNALKLGSDGLKELGADATALGITFERELLRRSENVLDQLSRLKDIVTATGVSFAIELAPRILTAAKALEQWIIEQGGVQVVVDKTITAIGNGIDRLSTLGDATIRLFDGTLSAMDKVSRGMRLLSAEAKVAAAELAEFANPGIGFRRDDEARLEAATDAARLEAARARQPEIFVGVNLNENQLEGSLGALRLELGVLQTQIDSGELGRQKFARVTAEVEAYKRAITSATDELDLLQLSTPDTLTIPTITATDTDNPAAPTDTSDPLKEFREQQDAARKKAAADAALRTRNAAAEQRQLEIATAQQSIQTLRESFDEKLRIENDFVRARDQLQASALLAGTDPSGLIEQLDNQRLQRLEEYYQRERDLIAQNAQAEADRIAEAGRLRTEEFNQRETARDLSSLTNFDTTQGLQSGLDEIQRLFLSEVKEINLAPKLDLNEKAQLITDAKALKDEAEAELQINARLSLANDVADVATGVLGNVAALQQPDDNSLLRSRADEIKEIRADLLSALQSGNDAEVASLESKLSAVSAIQSKEDAQAKRKFERYQKTQRAIATVAAFTTANQVFQETPGLLPIRLAAAGLALAAGLKNAKRIGEQQYNSSSSGGGSVGGGGAGGGTVTDQQLQDARNETTQQTNNTPNVAVFNVSRRARLDLNDFEEFVEELNDFTEQGGTQIKVNVVN